MAATTAAQWRCAVKAARARKRIVDTPVPQSVDHAVDVYISSAHRELELIREMRENAGAVRFALTVSCPKLLDTFEAWIAVKQPQIQLDLGETGKGRRK